MEYLNTYIYATETLFEKKKDLGFMIYSPNKP